MLEDSPKEQHRMQSEHDTSGSVLVRGRAGGQGVRGKIQHARRQFPPRVAKERACVVMLMDNTRFHNGCINDQEVMAAMYGEHVHYTTGESHFGSGRTTTPEEGTRISAVATIAVMPTPGALFKVKVYHNIYASVQLRPEDFYPKEDAHFVPWRPGVPCRLANVTEDGLQEAIQTARRALHNNEELKRRNRQQPLGKWRFYVDRERLNGTEHLLHLETCSYRLPGEMGVDLGLHTSFRQALANAKSNNPNWTITPCKQCSAARA